MYLRAGFYVSGAAHAQPEARQLFINVLEILGFDEPPDRSTPQMTININVGYWRKANQIHNWFVKNVQEGEDNCAEYFVPRDKLQELLSICNELEVLHVKGDPSANQKAGELLPPSSGFFFGGTAIDDGYWEDIEYTASTIRGILNNPKFELAEFYYRSSW